MGRALPAHVRVCNEGGPLPAGQGELGHRRRGLYSVHYPSIRQDMGGREKPTIYDEYCHLLDGKGDNPEQVKFDPAVRDHFGIQLQAYWDKIYRSEGALGGAIWNGVDTQQEARQRFSGNGAAGESWTPGAGRSRSTTT